MNLLDEIIEDSKTVPQTIHYRIWNDLCTVDDAETVLKLNNPYEAFLFIKKVEVIDLETLEKFKIMINEALKEYPFKMWLSRNMFQEICC